MTMIAKKGAYRVSVLLNPAEQTNTLVVHFEREICGSIDLIIQNESWDDWDGERTVPRRIVEWLEDHRDEWYDEADKMLGEAIAEIG
jgi:hypothetical protein